MDYLELIQNFIRNLCFFSGRVTMTLTFENEFEGFYGKASEAWETRACLTIESPDEKVCPNIKVIGARFDTIENVCYKAYEKIVEWQKNKEQNG